MKRKIKLALSSPKIKLCRPDCNAELCVKEATAADAAGADVIVFPELVLTGATAGDLFSQELLTDAASEALKKYIDATAGLEIMSFIGLPIRAREEVYNAIACVSCGEIIGVTASGIEASQLAALTAPVSATVAGREVELARDNVYTDEETGAEIFVKVGNDAAYSSDGVDIILNPTAMAEYIGLARERRALALDVSTALNVAFVIVGAGEGESGTDGIYAAPRLVAHGGEIIAESELFSEETVYAEIGSAPSVNSTPDVFDEEEINKYPFIPVNGAECDAACELALNIQSRSLAARIERSYAKCAVIGVSGGLDSTLAVLVCARAMDILGLPRERVIAITMPCFGTTERTKGNALALARLLGCTTRTIDIKEAVSQHFKDLGHAEDNYDVVYENAQARERTQILMDVANSEGGLVIGTGDLSELALGFATYNGDHMSMYCVNGSVPKTLMRKIITYSARVSADMGRIALSDVLLDVVNTPVSPELLPLTDGESNQRTEEIVGPYELHDFFLYYTVKYGYSPSKILSLAAEVFAEYSKSELRGYIDVFVRRFFSQQFKRSCLPDGPRVTEISLSPRSSWHMPSDVSGAIWRADVLREV